MSLFDNKKQHTRADLRKDFGRASSRVPGVGGKRVYGPERRAIVDDVFGRRYGSRISEKDVQSAMKDLKRRSRDLSLEKGERLKAKKKLHFLEERMK